MGLNYIFLSSPGPNPSTSSTRWVMRIAVLDRKPTKLSRLFACSCESSHARWVSPASKEESTPCVFSFRDSQQRSIGCHAKEEGNYMLLMSWHVVPCGGGGVVRRTARRPSLSQDEWPLFRSSQNHVGERARENPQGHAYVGASGDRVRLCIMIIFRISEMLIKELWNFVICSMLIAEKYMGDDTDYWLWVDFCPKVYLYIKVCLLSIQVAFATPDKQRPRTMFGIKWFEH